MLLLKVYHDRINALFMEHILAHKLHRALLITCTNEHKLTQPGFTARFTGRQLKKLTVSLPTSNAAGFRVVLRSVARVSNSPPKACWHTTEFKWCNLIKLSLLLKTGCTKDKLYKVSIQAGMRDEAKTKQGHWTPQFLINVTEHWGHVTQCSCLTQWCVLIVFGALWLRGIWYIRLWYTQNGHVASCMWGGAGTQIPDCVSASLRAYWVLPSDNAVGYAEFGSVGYINWYWIN